jgi:micrococcal nuclease
MLLRSSLFTILLAAGTAAMQAPPREIAGPVEAQVIRVRDGDTVEVSAHVWPMQAVHVAVRLRGVDAPELRARCEAESTAAEKARARLVELIGDGTVHLHRVAGDKYFGRVLADLATASEPDVARRLLSEGLVAPYEGGRRRDWCAARGS